MQVNKPLNKNNRQSALNTSMTAKTIEIDRAIRETPGQQQSFPTNPTLKKIESHFEKKLNLNKKTQPEPSYIEQKSGETSEFLSIRQEKPLPKLFQYKLDDPGERDHWNNIVDQFAKNDASSTFGNQTKADVPQINLNQLPKNNFNQANQNQNINQDRLRSMTQDLLNISANGSHPDEYDEVLQANVNRLFTEIKENPVDFLEGVKELEKMHTIKTLDEKVNQLEKDKRELKNIVNDRNTLLVLLAKKQKERETRLLEEIESLKEYAATNSEERIQDLRNENKRLRKELENQKNLTRELESQYKQDSDNYLHLYSDIEVIRNIETKKTIVEQLIQIKASKERLNQERKELESEKQEVLRMKEILSIQTAELLKHQATKNHVESTHATRNHYSEEYIPSQPQPQIQTRSNNQRREEGHAKFGNGHHREDPLLLNHNHNNNNHYYDNNQRRFHNTRDQLREDFANGTLRPQNTKFTETEYDNTDEDFGETERDRELFNQLEDRMPVSRDFGSVSSQADFEAPQVKELKEIFRKLEDMTNE